MRRGLAIITAMDFESEWLAGKGLCREVLSRKPYPVKRLKLGTAECLAVVSGVGKINAAGAATLLAERYNPAMMISLGIGGAYPGSGLVPGQIALATEEVLPDEGISDARGRFHPIESKTLRLTSRSSRRKSNRFPAHQLALARARKLLAGDFPGMGMGPFLTVSTVTGTDDRALQLRSDWGGLCENMEGAAVAQIADRYGVAFFEVRGISNRAGRRNPKAWRKEPAALIAQQALLRLLENSGIWLKGIGGE